jgi:hypothetical protein
VGESMPREQRQRYAEATIFAVVQKNLPFGIADEFADWWCRVGHLSHDDIANGFAAWVTGAQHYRDPDKGD